MKPSNYVVDVDRAHILALGEELGALRAERKEWATALQSLTPGGSEFQTPEACVDFARDLQRRRDEKLKGGIRERRVLAAENAGLREVVKETVEELMRRQDAYAEESKKLDSKHGRARWSGLSAGSADAANLIRARLIYGETVTPVTAAVQQVLEAVRVHEDVAERWMLACQDEEKHPVLPGSPLYHEFATAKDELTAAHDALQALLEGKGEGT